MAKVSDIKDCVRALMQENEESIKSYDDFFIPVLNTLIFENTAIDRNLKQAKGDADDGIGIAKINTLEDNLPFEDEIALGTLPYGIAAALLVESDANRAAYFLNQYKQKQSLFTKAAIKQIKDVM